MIPKSHFFSGLAIFLLSNGSLVAQEVSQEQLDQLQQMHDMTVEELEAANPLLEALTGTGDESPATGLLGLMIETKQRDDLELAISDQILQLDDLTEQVLTLIETKDFLRATINANKVAWLPMDESVDTEMSLKYSNVRDALLAAIEESQ